MEQERATQEACAINPLSSSTIHVYVRLEEGHQTEIPVLL